MKNKNTSKITTLELSPNPSLQCVQVDDVDWANTNWSDKLPATAEFRLDCSGVGITQLNESDVSITGYDGVITIVGISGKISIYDLSGREVSKASISNRAKIQINKKGVYFVRVTTEKTSITKKVYLSK